MTPSFEEFYAAQFTRLTIQLGAYLGDLGEAQDVVQVAFSRACRRGAGPGQSASRTAAVRTS